MAAMHWALYMIKEQMRPLLRHWRSYRVEACIVAVALGAGVTADVLCSTLASGLWRVERAGRRGGEPQAIEAVYWQALQEEPLRPQVLFDFLAIHHTANVMAGVEHAIAELSQNAPPASRVDEAEIDQLLSSIKIPGLAMAADFWRSALRGDSTPRQLQRVEAAADLEPPVPWCNHALGSVLLLEGDRRDAAHRFAREGLRPGGPVEDLKTELSLLLAIGDTEDLAVRVDDPRYRRAVSPHLRASLAFAEDRWATWLGWLWPATYARGDLLSWLLAGVSLGLWTWFCWRLGGARLHPLLLVAALALGALSVYPTHLLIYFGDLIDLRETGRLLSDAIYFCAGVGLREEGAKLLCCLPLLAMLRGHRSRSRGTALVLGAAVGLGFATIENVDYFSGGALATGLARFMTANFLHMSLTAVVADAAATAMWGRGSAVAQLSRTFGLAVVLHGAYDLFLSSPQLQDISFAAMATFVIIARLFLRSAPTAAARGGLPLFRVLVRALVILCGASFVYGAVLAGAKVAAVAMVEGVLGVVIIIIMFSQELAH